MSDQHFTLREPETESVTPPTLDPGASAVLTAGDGSVGQRLRAAREARALTVADAAQSLKLGPRQVEAIENEDWASLPGNTMIRGFVRNYARLLGLDSDVLMRDLDAAHLERTVQLDVSAGTSATLPPPGGHAVRRDYLTIGGGLLVVGLAAVAYFYLPADLWRVQFSSLLNRYQASSSPAVTKPEPSGGVPPTPASTVATPPDRPSSPAPATTPVTGPASASATLATPPPNGGTSVTVLTTPNAVVLTDAPAGKPSAAGGAAAALRLSFAQPGWAEVRDGRGEIVYSGVGAAGSSRDISGQPPLSVVIGNASQVGVQYQGRVIDLLPHIKGDVARLTLEWNDDR